jgi:lipopolysaccharide transport system ATP-binding protein
LLFFVPHTFSYIMSDIVLKVENLYKRYRLGNVDRTAFKEDIISFIAKLQGKPDPYESYITSNELAAVKDASEVKSRYVWSLQDINFEVKQGEVLGIIGKNGAGKSTLLKILSKTTAPTKGNVKVKGRIASLLEVGTGFHPELTGRENIYMNGAIMGMRKYEITKKLDEIIAFAGVEAFIDTPVKRYSSGMYVRLAFAVAAHLEPDILIVDEVLAVGDAEFQKKCIGKMQDVSKGEGRTVLFVSHNILAVKQLCNKGVLLKNGNLEVYGDIGTVIEKYVYKEKMNGESIPVDYSLYNTGEAKFINFAVLNDKGEVTQEVFYKEHIKLKIRLEIKKYIPDAILDIKIVTTDAIAITYTTTTFAGLKQIPMQVGHYDFEVEVENNLVPGNYAFNIGIHYSKGDSIDYIESIGGFTILPIAKDDSDYSLLWKHGFMINKAKWTSKQLNLHENTYL